MKTFKVISRSHQGSKNYLVVEQSIVVVFTPTIGVKYNPENKSKSSLADYEVRDYYKRTEVSDDDDMVELYTYLRDDVFNKTNAATKDYNFVLVYLANGKEICCNSYDSFIHELDSMAI